MSGWFGYSKGEGVPLPEAYSRVTNPERFLPLHTAVLETFGRLERIFEVERIEGNGLDGELARGVDLVRSDVRLVPADPDAAPITVVFTAFPGLYTRFGRWYTEPFPSCGCDACNESAESEIERLNERVDDVTAGRFRETIKAPLISFIAPGWQKAEFWSPGERRSRSGSRLDGSSARKMSGGRRRLDLNWKPWPRRLL